MFAKSVVRSDDPPVRVDWCHDHEVLTSGALLHPPGDGVSSARYNQIQDTQAGETL